ncbi:hypothetical protein BB31_21455 [Amycolatopsis lurida NRRL 2430]|uniref:Uncharacterized protein n=1 Tax=Amycolatopsis lurida NRRL 2430 TaxID=1460371 RepID=A0A2P2FR60_AMYLU|nr:hypothetical protein BB31_21455 [Amycolatopsis lurida NRRL 2430]
MSGGKVAPRQSAFENGSSFVDAPLTEEELTQGGAPTFFVLIESFPKFFFGGFEILSITPEESRIPLMDSRRMQFDGLPEKAFSLAQAPEAGVGGGQSGIDTRVSRPQVSFPDFGRGRGIIEIFRVQDDQVPRCEDVAEVGRPLQDFPGFLESFFILEENGIVVERFDITFFDSVSIRLFCDSRLSALGGDRSEETVQVGSARLDRTLEHLDGFAWSRGAHQGVGELLGSVGLPRYDCFSKCAHGFLMPILVPQLHASACQIVVAHGAHQAHSPGSDSLGGA